MLDQRNAQEMEPEVNSKMKAIVITKYGPPEVLQLKEVEKPTPTDNQVLVRVQAASVNPADLASVQGAFLARLLGTGLRKPKRKIFGTDLAGRVESAGGNVKQFQAGDEVFGAAPGSFAEFACARQDLLVLKPPSITFEEAAALPVAAITALQGLRDKGHIQIGQEVLIEGASGGVGTFAVQIAKSFGAEVTAVASTKKLDDARSLGADHVIDYTRENFTKSGKRYDLIIAANGHHSILAYRRSLKPNGVCVLIGGGMAQLFQFVLFSGLLSKTGSKKMKFFIAKLNHPDLIFLKELLEAGKLKPLIDRRYTINKVPEAVRYLEEKHARGKVVITL